jgi:hypothetical protein
MPYDEMKRIEKAILGLIQFSENNGMKGLFKSEEDTFIITTRKSKMWELLIFSIPITGFWIWFLLSNEKTGLTLFLLIGLTVYLTNIFLQISQAENIIEVDLKSQYLKIQNQSIIGKHFFKTKTVKCSNENEVVLTRKNFSRTGSNYRLSLKTSKAKYCIMDIPSEFFGEKFQVGLNCIFKENTTYNNGEHP